MEKISLFYATIFIVSYGLRAHQEYGTPFFSDSQLSELLNLPEDNSSAVTIENSDTYQQSQFLNSIAYKCPHCTKSIKSKSSFTAHMKHHCPVYKKEGVKRMYLISEFCKYCNRLFQKNELINHIEKDHPDKKNLQCSTCKVYFKNMRGFNYHLNCTHH